MDRGEDFPIEEEIGNIVNRIRREAYLPFFSKPVVHSYPTEYSNGRLVESGGEYAVYFDRKRVLQPLVFPLRHEEGRLIELVMKELKEENPKLVLHGGLYDIGVEISIDHKPLDPRVLEMASELGGAVLKALDRPREPPSD